MYGFIHFLLHVDVYLILKEPEVSLMTTLSGLQPATNYSLVLTAATNGGDTSGIPTYHLTGENGIAVVVNQ